MSFRNRIISQKRSIETFFFLHHADKRAGDGIQTSPQTMNAIVATGSHARSTSYSVSYCTKKTTNLPIDISKGKLECLIWNRFARELPGLVGFQLNKLFSFLRNPDTHFNHYRAGAVSYEILTELTFPVEKCAEPQASRN